MNNSNQKTKSVNEPGYIYKKISESIYMDIFIITLIVWVSYITDFYKAGNVTQQLFGFEYTVPAGYLSVFSTILSVVSVRLVTRRNNWGNLMQIFTPILSMYLAFTIGGNRAAFLTYPVTMAINYIVYTTWKNKNKERTPRKVDLVFFLAISLGMLISFVLTTIGFMYLGKAPVSFEAVMNNKLFWSFVFTGGLSIGGNITSIRMYSGLWIVTIIYILIRFSQAVIVTQDKPNIIWPEAIKYGVYFVNAVFAYVAWKVTENIHKKRNQ